MKQRIVGISIEPITLITRKPDGSLAGIEERYNVSVQYETALEDGRKGRWRDTLTDKPTFDAALAAVHEAIDEVQ